LCQTHHRQLITTGELKPIRPYRRRRPDTVKLAGLRLTPPCAEALERRAKSRGLSMGAVIADLLEEWHAESSDQRRGQAADG
jgi:hypothetical protein